MLCGLSLNRRAPQILATGAKKGMRAKPGDLPANHQCVSFTEPGRWP